MEKIEPEKRDSSLRNSLLQQSMSGQAEMLLNHYGFDLAGYQPEQIVELWAKSYEARWVRSAIIEALYQGRYKVISVSQILSLWKRRGQPVCHFNREFEHIICNSPLDDHAVTFNTSPEAGATEADTPKVATSHSPSAAHPPLPPRRMSLNVMLQSGRFISASPEALVPAALSSPDPEITTPLSLTDATPSLLEEYPVELSHAPIHQFIPTAPPAHLYQRLKAVAGTAQTVG